MKTLLLTGLIGSGKSAAGRILSEMGYPVYDSDSRTKALYASVPGLVEKIEDTIGVPFSEIAIIFSDEKKRAALEALVYPLVLEDWKRFLDSCESPLVVFESATASTKALFRDIFDYTVLVRAPYELRVLRNPKAAQRSQLQSEPGNPDYVIENNSDLSALSAEVNNMIKHLNI